MEESLDKYPQCDAVAETLVHANAAHWDDLINTYRSQWRNTFDDFDDFSPMDDMLCGIVIGTWESAIKCVSQLLRVDSKGLESVANECASNSAWFQGKDVSSLEKIRELCQQEAGEEGWLNRRPPTPPGSASTASDNPDTCNSVPSP
jgi:hypothetical protein